MKMFNVAINKGVGHSYQIARLEDFPNLMAKEGKDGFISEVEFRSHTLGKYIIFSGASRNIDMIINHCKEVIIDIVVKDHYLTEGKN